MQRHARACFRLPRVQLAFAKGLARAKIDSETTYGSRDLTPSIGIVLLVPPQLITIHKPMPCRWPCS